MLRSHSLATWNARQPPPCALARCCAKRGQQSVPNRVTTPLAFLYRCQPSCGEFVCRRVFCLTDCGASGLRSATALQVNSRPLLWQPWKVHLRQHSRHPPCAGRLAVGKEGHRGRSADSRSVRKAAANAAAEAAEAAEKLFCGSYSTLDRTSRLLSNTVIFKIG